MWSMTALSSSTSCRCSSSSTRSTSSAHIMGNMGKWNHEYKEDPLWGQGIHLHRWKHAYYHDIWWAPYPWPPLHHHMILITISHCCPSSTLLTVASFPAGWWNEYVEVEPHPDHDYHPAHQKCSVCILLLLWGLFGNPSFSFSSLVLE